jgi:hypothetical protein
MSDNLWTGAVRYGTAATKPTVPDYASETFGFFYESDTGKVNLGYSGGANWLTMGQLGHQPTPTAETATTALTAAKMLTRIITATSATAVTLTLPTGALTDAGILGGTMKADQAFEWTVINLGSASGAVTMAPAAEGHTYIGSTGIAITTQASFRTRKTAANTFVTYRLD